MIVLKHVKTEGYLPTSTFEAFDGDQLVGFCQLRHQISHAAGIPPEAASHIYYEIQEQYRCRGYGTAMLGLLKIETKRLGLHMIIITHLESNKASRRIIEKNGGKFVCKARTEIDEEIYVFQIIV